MRETLPLFPVANKCGLSGKQPAQKSLGSMLITLFLPFMLMSYAASAQTIRYVKAGGTGEASSWVTASGNLQEVIAASAAGDQVWVAAGTYKPTTSTDRNYSTIITPDGLKIGGKKVPLSAKSTQALLPPFSSFNLMNTAADANSCPQDIIVNNDTGSCGAEVNYTLPTSRQEANLTQSGSNPVTDFSTTRNCDNKKFSVLRSYNLPALGITNGFTVNSVNFAASDNSPVTINVYQWNPTTRLAYANFTLKGSTQVTVVDTLDLRNHPVSATIDAGFALIVEVVGNSGSFKIGFNNNRETAPYYTSFECVGSIGVLSFLAIVLNVNGEFDDAPTQTAGLPSGKEFPIGTTTNTFRYSDGTTCSFKVTVEDTQKPTISAPANLEVNNDAGECFATIANLGTPVSADNCPRSSVKNNAPATFPAGNTTVTWTVTDAAGLTATATQTVTVKDTEKPQLTCPAPVTACYSPNGTYTVPFLQASDNCEIPNASITYAITGATTRSGTGKDASGTFNPGLSTITWTVTDQGDNRETCSTTITVGTVITAAIPNTMALPQGVAVNTVYKGYAPASCLTLAVQASGGTAPYKYIWSTGATTTSLKVCPTITTTYTVTITDAQGCTTTARKQVNVMDVSCGPKNEKVTVCHKDAKGIRNSLCVSTKEVSIHLSHGDYLGSCSAYVPEIASSRSYATKTEFALQPVLKNAPNPFSGQTTIEFVLTQDEAYSLDIYDRNGRLIKRLSQGKAKAGKLNQVTWQVGNAATGLYIARLITATSVQQLKLMVK